MLFDLSIDPLCGLNDITTITMIGFNSQSFITSSSQFFWVCRNVCVHVCLCVAESMTNQHLVGWPTNVPSLHKISRLIILRYRTKDPHSLNLFISHIRLLWHIIEHPSISYRRQLHRIAPRRWCTFSTFKSPSDHWFYFEGFLNSSAWSLSCRDSRENCH